MARKIVPAPLPTPDQRLDKLAVRIRDKLVGVLEQNVDAVLGNLDALLNPPQQSDVVLTPRAEVCELAQAAPKPRALASGQPSKRKCGNCRQSGHRAPGCPNPKADADEDPEPARVTPKRLAWDETCRLIKLVQETGDRRAMDWLIRANMGLVHRVAKSCPWHILPYEDVVQEGAIGLMKGILKFDTTRGFKLSTYATWWIRHNIIRSHEDNAVIRMPARYGMAMVKLRKSQMALEGQGAVTVEELSAHSGVPINDVKRLLVRGRVSQSLDHILTEDGESALHDILASDAVAPDEELERTETAMSVRLALDALPEREAKIIKMRYMQDDGLTLREIGDQMDTMGGNQGISRERVRQMERDALERLRRRLRKLAA